MTGLQLALLGRFRATIGHQPAVEFKTRRAQALLIYLAAGNGSGDLRHHREGLMELLWPGMPPQSARRSLRQTIYYLRQSIGDLPAFDDQEAIKFLLADRSTVQVNPAYPMQVDVADFCRILDGPESQWPDAVALYEGDFLVDFYLPDTNPFEEWAAYRRADYRRMVLGALEKLTADRLARHEYGEAEEYALRQLVIDNLRESAYRQLMQLYAWSGRHSEALSLYQDCVQILDRELGSPPDGATTALYEAIKENRLPLPEEGKLPVEIVTKKSAPPPSPYRGLFAFREEDAPYFFGRELFTERLVEMVDKQPLVAFIGPSGSGKSSILHAGLQARLRQQEAWQVISFRPGNRPFQALAAALLPSLEPEMTETERLVETNKLARALQDGDLSMTDVVGRIQQKGQDSHRLLLLADQFEELYTHTPEGPDQRLFVDLLLELVSSQQNKPNPTSCFSFAMRADFLDLALSYRPFADALQGSTLILAPMTQEELGRAIEKPAEIRGVSFEHGLVDRILTDVGGEPGNLPLLEFTLDSLWERQSDRQLTHAAYDDTGRVEEALARYADKVHGDLEPADRERARHIFVQLVRPGRRTNDTRRMSHRSELGEENWALAQRLADARLVVIDRDPTGHETVELVHETLLRRWGRLQAWLDEDRAFRVWQERMRIALEQWEASERDEGALLRGALLTEAEGWLKDRKEQFNPAEATFIEAGCAQRDRRERNRRRATIGLAAGLLLAVALAVLAIWQWRSAQQARLVAESERDQTQVTLSHLLASQSQLLLDEQIDLSLLLALEALNTADSPKTRGALLAAVSHYPYLQAYLYGHQDQVQAVAISPDGRTMASGGFDKTIILWDLVTGRAWDSSLSGHSDVIRSLAFSPDGRTLASGSSDDTVILWDLATGRPVMPPLSAHAGDVWSVDFSPGGDLLASGAADGTIRFWDPRTGRPVGDPIKAHNATVASLAFSPTDRVLASAGRDNTTLLWDVSTFTGSPTSDPGRPAARQLGQPLKGHSGLDRALAFSPDGRILAIDGDDNTILLWDMSEVDAAAHPDRDPADQDNIVIGPIGDPITGHGDWITSLAFGAVNETLVSADRGGQLILWDLSLPAGSTGALTSHKSRSFTGQGASIWDVAFSPDGRTLVMGEGSGRITLWNMAGQHPLSRYISGPGGRLTTVALDPDGRILAVGGADGSLTLYDVGGDIDTFGQVINQVRSAHTFAIRSASFSADGSLLVTSDDDGAVILWQVEPLSLISTPAMGHDRPIYFTLFSKDGRTLLSVDYDDKARLWDVDTGRLITESNWEDLYSPPGTTPGPSMRMDFLFKDLSPDGNILATVDRNAGIILLLLDVATGRQVGEPLSLHKGRVVGLAFDPGGDTLVSIGVDGQIILWDVAAHSPTFGQPYGPPIAGPTLGSFGNFTSFSKGAHRLVTGRPDGSILLWELDIDSWRSLACRRAGRNLTQEEWRQFFGNEPYHLTCPDLP